MFGFIGGNWVHSCGPWRLSDSFGFVGFMRVRPWRRCVHSGVPWVSFGVVRMRPGCCRIHSEALSSFGCALGVIVGRWVKSG